MPQYELMYIVASSVSDDQIPSVTEGVLNFIKDLGGTILREDQLGKKKLAYPIKKTRNGFYELVLFNLPAPKVAELDAKIRTNDGIIRHLIVNMDEANIRAAKDADAQAKMNKGRAERAAKAERAIPAGEEITDENLDAKIEEALTEDIKNA